MIFIALLLGILLLPFISGNKKHIQSNTHTQKKITHKRNTKKALLTITEILKVLIVIWLIENIRIQQRNNKRIIRIQAALEKKLKYFYVKLHQKW